MDNCRKFANASVFANGGKHTGSCDREKSLKTAHGGQLASTCSFIENTLVESLALWRISIEGKYASVQSASDTNANLSF